MPANSPRRYDVVRHRIRGMKARFLVVLRHHDVPSTRRIIAPLTESRHGDHDGVAPRVRVDGTAYRVRLLNLATCPMSAFLEKIASVDANADAITHALDIIFGGYPVGRPR